MSETSFSLEEYNIHPQTIIRNASPSVLYEEALTYEADATISSDGALIVSSYEKTIDLLDEDIANRTPDEQRKALKISGLMSVLVASKKLKRAISTIDDYDLPDDPDLREISAALSEWLSKNLVTK